MVAGRQWPWNAEGSELFYGRREGGTIEIHVVPVGTEAGFNIGRDELLFAGEYAPGWDVSPDGQSFLMLKPVAGPGTTAGAESISLVLIDNWFEELNRLAPPLRN